MTREDRCPMCGAAVRVVTGGEGTSHYEPLDVRYEPAAGEPVLGGITQPARSVRDAMARAVRVRNTLGVRIWPDTPSDDDRVVADAALLVVLNTLTSDEAVRRVIAEAIHREEAVSYFDPRPVADCHAAAVVVLAALRRHLERA